MRIWSWLRRPVRWTFAATAVLLLSLAACGSSGTMPASGSGSGGITIEGAWARPTPAGMSSATPMAGMAMASGTPGSMDMGGTETTDAIYFTIHNAGGQDDQLVGASSQIAQAVELHQSVMQNGVMAMQPVKSVDVPAGGTVEFKPGSYHVMLIGLRKDLNAGDHFDVTLTFTHAGAKTVSVEVKQD
jgi:copper(I)-binding protein